MKTTPTKRSAKAVRAQIDPHGYTDSKGVTIPVFVLPAAPEDVERMREAVARWLAGAPAAYEWRPELWQKNADELLALIGLTPAKKTKAK